jgi:hypothetical protein
MKKYLAGEPNIKKPKNGEKYYEEFRTEFWAKPGKYYLLLFIHLDLYSV